MPATTPSPAAVSPLAESDHATAKRLMVPAAIGTVALYAFFYVLREAALRNVLILVPACTIVTALVYGLVVRPALRRESASVPALILAVLGLLLFPTYYTSLPLVLGGAGALLGFAGKRASSRSGLCIAALVVGSLAVIGFLAAFIGDWIANPGGAWYS